MATTSNNDLEPTTTAVVTIRIPCGTDNDLVTDAEERLSQGEDIDGVSIDELRSLDPKLSATVIAVEITLRWTVAITDAQARRRLTEVPGLESMERIG